MSFICGDGFRKGDVTLALTLLTTILTISISVIRGARKMIFFHVFRVDKFNEIKIGFVTCTVDFSGQYGDQATPGWPF